MYEKFVVQMKDMVRNEINKVHTALPGEIIEVDPESGFCTVQPKGQLHISGRTERVLDFPPIAEVPMLFPYSKTAGAEFAFPVKAGDDCLIVFSEQALEYWLGTGLQNSALKHSLSNAICIPGLMKELPDGMREAIETDSVIVRKGESKVSISGDGICLAGDVTINGNLSVNGVVTVAESVMQVDE